VFGQMVTFESRRGAKVLERYGFRVVEKREITKWRDKHPEPVYLTTVIKQLTGKIAQDSGHERCHAAVADKSAVNQ
jgi:hypothetical protein